MRELLQLAVCWHLRTVTLPQLQLLQQLLQRPLQRLPLAKAAEQQH